MSFTQILNVSISASWLVGIIVLLRFALKRAPKALVCALWALVALRLLCPVLPESSVSLVPTVQVVPEEYLAMEPSDYYDGERVVLDIVTNPIYPQTVDIPLPVLVSSYQWDDLFWTLGWWAGMGVMALYALYSYISLRLRIRVAVKLRENIWLCDDIDSPFVLGVFRPRICIPSGMDGTQMPHVIAHEQAHLKRRDHWWKPLGFALLTVHWFNPVMWVAYGLLCRDIELACDEKVIRGMDRASVRAYSEALIACGTRQRFVAACPLAFGEVGVKERVKSMVNYEKPGFWIILIAVVLSVAAAVCFLTNPAATTIGNLKEPQFEGFFDEAESIWFFRDDRISVTDQAEETAKRLEAIELEPKPISQSLAEDRDSTFMIRVNGQDGLSLRISEDCSQIWADGVKPSYSYGVKEPEQLRAILAEFLPGVDMNVLPFLGTYVSYDCLYMNLLSSFYPFAGDSQEIYSFEKDRFTIERRNGTVTVYDPMNWDWKTVDWDAEPFVELNLPGKDDLRNWIDSEAMYQVIDVDRFLLYESGRLLLVDTIRGATTGRDLWSVYRLIPEEEMGKAEWTFNMHHQTEWPGFRFEFDMEYDYVSASTVGGRLCSYDEPSPDGYPSGQQLAFPAGTALYWCPIDDHGYVSQSATIRFFAMDGDDIVAEGMLYITGTEGKYETVRNGDETTREIEPAVYTAKLVGTGLRLGQNAGRSGGLIDETWIRLGTAVIEE